MPFHGFAVAMVCAPILDSIRALLYWSGVANVPLVAPFMYAIILLAELDHVIPNQTKSVNAKLFITTCLKAPPLPRFPNANVLVAVPLLIKTRFPDPESISIA